jgi:hypothetical protein
MQLDMTAFRMPPQVVLTWLLHIELQYVAVVGCASKRTSMAHTAMAADRLWAAIAEAMFLCSSVRRRWVELENDEGRKKAS